MEFIESEYLELKEIVTANLIKEIVAFANANGGEIYIGVTKFGEIIGIDNIEKEMEHISNIIHNNIKPDLKTYTNVERVIKQNKNLIKITVSRGEKRPYHISKKGLKPSGVYIRHGVTSVPASDETIRQMIKESDGTTFDKARSINQELTFNYTEKFFKERGVGFEESNKRSLKLLTDDGYFTNAALLLSDQCEHSIKCAVYDGIGKTTFQSRKEFYGSIIQQMNEAYKFISNYNRLGSTFKGLYRIDTRDYPEYAIREALINTVVHRDYDYSGSTIINIFNDRMEFVSIGGLVKGITLEDILGGVSQPRNFTLASIFYRLELIESYGTGIRRIIESYIGRVTQPVFKPAPSSFVVILPNINENAINKDNLELKEEDKILNLFETNEAITRKDVENILHSSSFPANRALNELLDKDKIIRIGSARATKYILKKIKKISED